MARRALAPHEIEAFRARLVEAALVLCAERGYEGLTLRAVAQAMGCSHATPYRYFASKEEIFAAVRAEGFRRFADHLEAGMADASDPLARLRRIGPLYFAFADAQPDAFRVMFSLKQGGQEWPGLNPQSERAWGLVHRAVEEAIQAGRIAGDSAVIGHLLWAGIHGITTLHSARKLALGLEARALIDPMQDALLRAWRPNPLEESP
jgi:AcrR family transcriptional regulator